MASTILSDNGVTSGSAGLKTTAASDGALALQTTTAGGAATTAVTIDTSQNVGIGTDSPTAGLDVVNWGESTSPTLVAARGTIPTTATGTAIVVDTIGTTLAASSPLVSLLHYRARPNDTFGAGSALTNQYGYYADSRLTGATNNYGFYSNIASGTGRYNFYAAGTADNYFAGNLLRGYTSAVATTTYTNFSLTPPLQTHGSTAGNSSVGLFNWSSSGGSTSSLVFSKSLGGVAGTRGALTAASSDLGNIAFSGDDGTNFINAANILVETDGTPGVNAMPGRFSFYTTRGGVYSISTVARVSNTVTLVATARMNVVVGDTIVVAGVTDTGFNGTFTIATLVGTTITYAQTAADASSSGGTVTAQSTTAVERVRIDSAGNVGIGATSITNTALRISKNITGSVSSYALFLDGSVQADVTSNAYVIRTTPATQATSFTLPNLFHFNANQGTFGAGSTVTNQFGFTVDNSLTGATNNYGFYGDIASGTGRYNFYAAGTAQNYFAGNVGIGNTGTSVLDAVGAARPLSVQKSDTNTTLNGSLAAITITNGDTTTNNTAQLNFAAITGASTNQYSSGIISCVFGARTNGQYPTGQLVFSTSTSLNTAPSEKMRIMSDGNVLIGKTTFGSANVGVQIEAVGAVVATRTSEVCFIANRLSTDGDLFLFRQDNTTEGSISVSGTTVSYNGGHLSRYAQTTTAKDELLVKGTVLSNLDAMNVYTDAEGNPVANEQLNKVKVSDVEGDANVAGVFVNWTYDEQHSVDEINMAMTGDMIIRIAQGVTVQRGDLLMSAGDGTAKTQGDDIVRSKTIAKVTSNHVTCTYADGSYCVPCVLMAC